MKAINNTISKLKSIVSLPIYFLFAFFLLGVLNTTAQICQDSINTSNITWLDASIDTLNENTCEQNCFTSINAYCLGNPSGELIFAYEPGENCSNIPTTFYSEDGNFICISGGNSASNCNPGFVDSLIFLDNIFECNEDQNNCDDFYAQITANITNLDSVCIGETITLSAIPFGGTPPYTYAWFQGSATQTITINPTPNITEFIVLVTDANGCVYQDAINIEVTNCQPDTTCNCPTVVTPVCVANPSGDIITFSNDCFAACEGYTPNDFVDCNDSISCNSLDVSIETSTLNEPYCIGDTITLTGIPSGGNPPYTVEWDGTWLSTPPSINVSLDELVNIFTVTVYDSEGCDISDVITIIAEDCDSDSTNNCNNIPINTSLGWLDALVDSLNNIGCENNCYSSSSILCSNNTGNSPIYSLNANEDCSDVPTIYYDIQGNIICSDGSFAGNNCDSGFVENLIYISNYWTCEDIDSSCLNFSVEIDGSIQDTICIGETLVLTATATGGTQGYTYLWNNGQTSAAITVNPTPNNFYYSVTSTDANGCETSDTIFIDVYNCISDSNNVCDDSLNCVFPGDGNKNFLVNNYDVLNIGFGFNASGPARNQVSIDPQFYQADNWNDNGINSINLKHADCNGDGIINILDIEAINQNYNEDTDFNESFSNSNDEISLNVEFIADTIVIGNNPNDTSSFVILEAELTLEQGVVKSSLSGLAFQIEVDNIDGTLVDAYVSFDDDSWLTANNNAITFSRFISSDNRIDAAVSRTDQIPVANSGKIGKVYMVIEDIIIGRVQNESIEYAASAKNVMALNSESSSVSIKGEKDEIVLSADIVSNTSEDLIKNINIFPNPVKQKLFIQSNHNIETVEVYSLQGKLLIKVSNQNYVDLAGLTSTQYIVKIITNKGVITHRVIKVD